MSQALDTPKSAVPDLVRTPALEIGAEDVALPRIYVGQHMSSAVQDGLVKAGQIFTAVGKEDPDPNVIYAGPEDKKAEPFTFYVLGMRKGKSISEGGELILFDFDDPNAPDDAWTTYNYTVAIPSIDTDVPYKWLLTRTGAPAAKQINLALKKNEALGPPWTLAFKATTAYRENAKGKFYVPRVAAVEADAAQVEAAGKLAEMVSGQPDPAPRAAIDAPAI